MTDPYLHSMAEFADLILAALDIAGARNVVEIGAEEGGMSCHLAARAARIGGHVTCIDPAPRPAFLDWVRGQEHVRHLAATSLDAMPGMGGCDAWMIDGDHNYYTVLHELKIADALSRRDGRPLLAFLHDVGWPCGRRDFYYAPERIPEDWRQPHRFDVGVTIDMPGVRRNRGLRGEGSFAVALFEGGPHNGVLTAVEDFLDHARTPERPLAFAMVPLVLGLGVVFDASVNWAPELAEMLRPWHDNRMLAAVEHNRLRNYLTALEWQDEAAARGWMAHVASNG